MQRVKWLLRGGTLRPDLDWPHEEWAYFQAAERWGWTPEQFDEAPAALTDLLLALGGAVDEVRGPKE